MVQSRTVLNVLDNSGVRKIRLIQLKGQKVFGGVGTCFVGSAIKVRPNTKYKKGDVVQGLIVQTRKKSNFRGGQSLRFKINGCVVLLQNGEPVGSRIKCTVPTELRRAGHAKILILSSKRI